MFQNRMLKFIFEINMQDENLTRVTRAYYYKFDTKNN